MIDERIADATDEDGNIDYAKLGMMDLAVLAQDDGEAMAQLYSYLSDAETWKGVGDEEREAATQRYLDIAAGEAM